MKFRIILVLMICVFSSGCSTRLGDFTVISTKNVNLSDFTSHPSGSLERVRGEDCGHIIICFPNKNPSFKEAVDIALEENNAIILTDAVLKYEWFYIPYIYGQSKFIAEGIPVKRKL